MTFKQEFPKLNYTNFKNKVKKDFKFVIKALEKAYDDVDNILQFPRYLKRLKLKVRNYEMFTQKAFNMTRIKH